MEENIPVCKAAECGGKGLLYIILFTNPGTCVRGHSTVVLIGWLVDRLIHLLMKGLIDRVCLLLLDCMFAGRVDWGLGHFTGLE